AASKSAKPGQGDYAFLQRFGGLVCSMEAPYKGHSLYLPCKTIASGCEALGWFLETQTASYVAEMRGQMLFYGNKLRMAAKGAASTPLGT
ncbi:hypothetical protein KIPB_014331, partial [Kipferlia bialata]